MKHRICLTVLFVVILVGAIPVSAQQSRGRGIYGDWVVKQEFQGRTFESILSFSRDQEGNYTGYYISFMGMSELQDVKFADGKLSFSRSRRNRDGETSTSTFTGTIADGELSGTMTGGTREYELKGKRSPRISRAVGKWELTYSMGEREITSPLIIKADAQGQLSAQSPSERVEHTITDLAYERGELKFKRTTKMGERQFESSFAGTIQGNDISGTFTSQRGETPVKGTRVAPVLPLAQSLLGESAAIGTLLFVNDGFAVDDLAPLAGFAAAADAPALAALVFGTDEGGVALMPDGSPAIGPSGERIDTTIDTAILARVGREASLDVIRSEPGDRDITAALRVLTSNLLAAEDPDARWKDAGWWFLWPAALLLLAWFRRGWSMQW